METLKTIWDEDPERCYSLHRVAGRIVRVRSVFGRRLVGEIFSPSLRWELLTMPTERILEHTKEHVDCMTTTVLDEVKLILDDDVLQNRRHRGHGDGPGGGGYPLQ